MGLIWTTLAALPKFWLIKENIVFHHRWLKCLATCDTILQWNRTFWYYLHWVRIPFLICNSLSVTNLCIILLTNKILLGKYKCSCHHLHHQNTIKIISDWNGSTIKQNEHFLLLVACNSYIFNRKGKTAAVFFHNFFSISALLCFKSMCQILLDIYCTVTEEFKV